MPAPACPLTPKEEDNTGRRAFIHSAIRRSLILTVGASFPFRLLADAVKNPEFRSSGVGGPAQAESTRRMAELLQKIIRGYDPMNDPFRSGEQLKPLRALVAQTTDVESLIKYKILLARQLVNAGFPDEALKENEDVESTMRANNIVITDQVLPVMLTVKAICYLRMGEQENCMENHNAESCMFPIKGTGVHKLQRGSRGAVAVLTELMDRFPSDLRARWLLNIAYMTLGEYPDKVPARWLIDPKHFASDYEMAHFPDIAANVGLDIEGRAGSVVLEDFDNRGFLDLMLSKFGINDQLQLFRNNGDGTFTERTVEAGLLGEVGGLNMIQCDYNNDGLMDVLVLRGAWLASQGNYPCSLLRNNGNGTFTDVTVEAGLLRFHPTQTAVWFDYNNDGWLDLFIGNESTGNPNPCELFRNNGDGTFTECAAEHGVDFVGYFKGVVSADFNNDGRPGLLLSRRDGPPILLRNDGPAGTDKSPRGAWRFTNIAEDAGITEPHSSFPCWFWDYNNDGWLDVMISGYQIQDVGDVTADYLGRPNAGERARLFRNNGDGTFTDVSKETGVYKLLVTMGCNFGDLDNDGWLDFYMGTGDPDFATLIPNRMFRNDRGKRFQDVTTSGGFGQLQKGHGIAFGDINNSGSQDIYSVVGGALEADTGHNQLFANPGNGNNWIKLKLEGVNTNRAAIGARIKVVAESDEGAREIHRVVGSGASFGASPMRQEIGLGRAGTIKRVEIYWPVTGVTQVVTGLEVNRFYKIRESVSAPEEVKLKSFQWPKTALLSRRHEMGAMVMP